MLRRVDDLEKLTAAYRRSERSLDVARAKLHDVIRRELAAGRMQTEVAKVTGFTREHLRQIAKKS
jgi:hypothetical protein